MKSIELKIKSKHLSLEPAIIRKEEERLKRRIKYHQDKQENEGLLTLQNKLWRLSTHRKFDVRNEARATFLARTFIEGKTYLSTERKRKDDRETMFQKMVIPRILAMIKKYGSSEQATQTTEESIKTWAKLESVKA